MLTLLSASIFSISHSLCLSLTACYISVVESLHGGHWNFHVFSRPPFVQIPAVALKEVFILRQNGHYSTLRVLEGNLCCLRESSSALFHIFDYAYRGSAEQPDVGRWLDQATQLEL